MDTPKQPKWNTHCERIYKTHLSPPLPVAFSSTEIRGGVLAATTMVRPAITIQQPVPIWILERYSSLRWYLVAGHVLHNARRLQGPAHTCSLRPTYISQRHGQLSYEVLFRLFLIIFFIFIYVSRIRGHDYFHFQLFVVQRYVIENLA